MDLKTKDQLTKFQLRTVEGFKNAAYNDALGYIAGKSRQADINNVAMDIEKVSDEAWEYSKDQFERRCKRHGWFIQYENDRLASYLEDVARGCSREHEKIVQKFDAKKQNASWSRDINEIKVLTEKLNKLASESGLDVTITFTEKENN